MVGSSKIISKKGRKEEREMEASGVKREGSGGT